MATQHPSLDLQLCTATFPMGVAHRSGTPDGAWQRQACSAALRVEQDREVSRTCASGAGGDVAETFAHTREGDTRAHPYCPPSHAVILQFMAGAGAAA